MCLVSSENTNKDVTILILWALSFLPERQICKMCMKDEDLLKLVLKCYKESTYAHIRLPALRFLGNICADDDILARKLIVDHGLIETMKETIKSKLLCQET